METLREEEEGEKKRGSIGSFVDLCHEEEGDHVHEGEEELRCAK